MWTIPPNLRDWVDRDEEIATLQGWLDSTDVHIMEIWGLGGVGKSALAAYLFSKNDSEGLKRVWIDVSYKPDFVSFAETLINQLGGNITQRGNINQIVNDSLLCLIRQKCVLVIDNLETLLDESYQWVELAYEQFFSGWLQRGKNSILLLTSQDKPSLFDGLNYWYDLGGMKLKEGVKLLHNLAMEGTEKELEDLVTFVDKHPLTLRLVGAFLREYCQSKLSRIGELNLNQFELVYKKAQGVHRNKTDARLIWVIEQHLERLNEPLRQFLYNLSVYRQPFNLDAAGYFWQDEEKPYQQLRELYRRSLLGVVEDCYQCPLLIQRYVENIEPDLTSAHQTALNYYLTHLKPKPWQSQADVKEYLDAVYHWCQLEQYDTGFDLLRHIDEFLTLQGHYGIRVEYYSLLVDFYARMDDPYNWRYTASLTSLGNAYRSLKEYQRAIEYHQQSLDIDREIGDRHGEANSYGNLGSDYGSLGEYQRAIAFFQQSLDIAKEIGDHHGEANSYMGLGSAYYLLGEYQRAIAFFQQSLDIAKEIGAAEGTLLARNGEANSYNNLGAVYYSLGEYQRAIAFHQQSLEIAKEIGDRHGEAKSYDNLGNAYNSLGENQRAIAYHQQSLEIAKEIGDRYGEAASYNNLATAYNSLGEYQRAIAFFQQSLDITREIGDRNGEANSYMGLGTVYYSLGEYQRAIEYHQQSLDIFREIGDRNGEANTLLNLSNVYNKCGRVKEEYTTAYQANLILQELELPLTAMPYPQWLKNLILFAQRGKVQLVLCFIGGVIAFPFVVVGLILLFLWRLMRRR